MARAAGVRTISDLPGQVRARSAEVGISSEPSCRAGSFFLLDDSVVTAASVGEEVEVMDLAEALERRTPARDVAWTMVGSDLDRHTADVASGPQHGVFIRARPGARLTLPLQACMFLAREGSSQLVHNVVIAEAGSEVHLLTGCTAGYPVRSGRHVGITEIHVGESAVVTATW